jgi:hypothetical protein
MSAGQVPTRKLNLKLEVPKSNELLQKILNQNENAAGDSSPILQHQIPLELGKSTFELTSSNFANLLKGGLNFEDSTLSTANNGIFFPHGDSVQSSNHFLNFNGLKKSNVSEGGCENGWKQSIIGKTIESVKASLIMGSVIVDKNKEELTHLRNLFDALSHAFEGSPILTSSSPLDSKTALLLISMLTSKLQKSKKAHTHETNVDIMDRVNSLPQLLQENATKRLEECFKFVMNKLFKKLKKNFRQEHQMVVLDEPKFYQFYFGSAANDLGLPMEAFTYPQVNKSGQSAFRLSYFKNLFHSESFKNAFDIWAKNSMWKDYKKSIGKKLNKGLAIWEKLIEQDPSKKTEVLEEMIKSFSKSKKQKLPWTKYEVSFALDKIKGAI